MKSDKKQYKVNHQTKTLKGQCCAVNGHEDHCCGVELGWIIHGIIIVLFPEVIWFWGNQLFGFLATARSLTWTFVHVCFNGLKMQEAPEGVVLTSDVMLSI